MSCTAPVAAELSLQLLAAQVPSLPVTAVISYDSTDPYAVTIGFRTGNGEVIEWVFARSLLTDGVTAPAGRGDVQVWPVERDGEHRLALCMSSPSGRALFETALGDVLQFLARTYTLVPPGAEASFVDWDAGVAQLLGS